MKKNIATDVFQKYIERNAQSVIILFYVAAVLTILAIFLGVSFGSFALDYYESHLVTLNQFSSSGFLTGTHQMHLSASGALPLWFQSHFEGLNPRRIVNVTVWIMTIFLIYKNLGKIGLPEGFKYLFLISYCISPMMMSSASWGLSEIYALFFLSLAVYLVLNNWECILVPVLYSFIILCRQNLLGILFFSVCFLRSKKIQIISILGALTGIVLLLLLWGGLVPRGLERHMTPSLRTFIYSLAIFSLYFLLCEKTARKHRFNVISAIAFTVTFIIYSTPDLLGGGYIYSRIESFSKILSIFVLTLSIYSLYITKSNLLIFYILISSLTLSTTNYIFLKYVDFFVYFIFLLQLLAVNGGIKIAYRNKFTLILAENLSSIKLQIISITFFQMISLLISSIYYGR